MHQLILSIFNTLLVERTTAATDFLLVLLAIYYIRHLYSAPVNDRAKRKYWALMIGYTGAAAFFGTIAHGFNLPESTQDLLWQPIYFCLGFVIAFFVQGAIHEKWGKSVSDKFLPWVLFVAIAFYFINLLIPGTFLIFVAYEALGMIFALGVFTQLYLKERRADHGLMIIAIILSIAAAVVQGTGSLHFTLIWPFDHNSSFHLLQALSSVFIFLSLKKSLYSGEMDLESNEIKEEHIEYTRLGMEEEDSFDRESNLDEGPLKRTAKKKSLRQFPILEGFTKKQLARIKLFGHKEKHGINSKIIEEGSKAKYFYLVRKGEVSIQKDGVILAKKHLGDTFGIMPLIDNSDRSADVVASMETELLAIPFKKVRKSENKDIFNKLVSNQLHSQQNDLRRMNDVTIAEVKEKLKEAHLREESSMFFITLVFVLVLYKFILGCFMEWGDILRNRSVLEIITPLLTVFLGVISYLHAYKSKFHISEFGFTMKNWKKDLPMTLQWTACFIMGIIFFKWIITLIPGPYYGKPILDPSNMLDFSPWTLVGIYFLYVVLVPVQEIVARGVIQGSLMKIFSGNWATLKAILLSNAMFSAFHIYLDMKFAVLTFIPGIFWGYMYARQGSLFGVSLSHIIIGLFALTLIGVT